MRSQYHQTTGRIRSGCLAPAVPRHHRIGCLGSFGRAAGWCQGTDLGSGLDERNESKKWSETLTIVALLKLRTSTNNCTNHPNQLRPNIKHQTSSNPRFSIQSQGIGARFKKALELTVASLLLGFDAVALNLPAAGGLLHPAGLIKSWVYLMEILKLMMKKHDEYGVNMC